MCVQRRADEEAISGDAIRSGSLTWRSDVAGPYESCRHDVAWSARAAQWAARARWRAPATAPTGHHETSRRRWDRLHQEAGMGIFDKAKEFAEEHSDEAQEFAQEHSEQVGQAIDQAGDMVDDKTDGKFTGQVDQAQQFLKDRVGGDAQ